MSARYDAVVIGAGIGGLAAAGLLARHGRTVLVLEQHAVVGGYCSTFRRGRFIFDAAVHAIGGCARGDMIGQWLEDLGSAEEIAFTRLDPFYRVHVGGEGVDVPADLDALQQTLTNLSPADAAAVRRLVAEVKALGSTLLAPGGSPMQQAEILQRTGRLSWTEFLEGRFRSKQVEAVLGALCLYAGAEPERLSAAFMLGALYSYHLGAFYPVGGSQRLADVMAAAVRRWGGEVRCRAAVEHLLLRNGAAAGVRLASGEEIHADVVLSNADAASTLLKMVGRDELPPAFVRRFARLERSVSSVTMYLGVQEGGWPVPAHETFFLPSWEPVTAAEFYYRPGEHADPPMLSVCVPTASEPSLAPPGHQILCVTTCCDAERVERLRDERGKAFIAQDLLAHVERLIPGVAAKVRYQETATPRTFERYTRNSGGSIYGWAKSTSQSWTGGIGPRTPVPGLYLAGHWTQGVHGVYGAFRSGVETARTVLRESAAPAKGWSV